MADEQDEVYCLLLLLSLLFMSHDRKLQSRNKKKNIKYKTRNGCELFIPYIQGDCYSLLIQSREQLTASLKLGKNWTWQSAALQDKNGQNHTVSALRELCSHVFSRTNNQSRLNNRNKSKDVYSLKRKKNSLDRRCSFQPNYFLILFCCFFPSRRDRSDSPASDV